MYIHVCKTHLSIFASLLDHGMKEGQYVDKGFECRVGAGRLLQRGRGDLEVRVPQI